MHRYTKIAINSRRKKVKLIKVMERAAEFWDSGDAQIPRDIPINWIYRTWYTHSCRRHLAAQKSS